MTGVIAHLDEPLDATIAIVTPENIEYEYRVAGPFRRLPALVLDYTFRLALMAALWTLLGLLIFAIILLVPSLRSTLEMLTGMTTAFLIILWFVLDWFYGGLFETYWNGQTPGKRLLGIRVVSLNGQPINGLQAALRNILRYADLFPMLSLEMFNSLLPPDADMRMPPVYLVPTLLVGLLAMTLTRRYQRLGDIVCGTMVVLEERPWLVGVAKLDDPRAPQLAAYLPANFVVSRSLARALAMYVDRRRFFTALRRREVARHLAEPLLRQFNLPADTSYDLLLCALYYRAFVADQGDTVRPASLPVPVASAPAVLSTPQFQ